MKKLLLILLVLAITSFLFVGCLPVTPSEGEGEDEGEGEVEVAIAFDKEYTNASGVTFVPCHDDVTVTFPTAVAVDYVVYVAVKTAEGDYECMEAMTPNADRTVWTLSSYEMPCCDIDECEPFCIVALVKHPCCPGEEIALRVVLADCTPPTLDLFVKFTDCDDPCDDPDPCVPEFEGVSMEWSSRTTDICETTDCCNDTCSGVNGWSLLINPEDCVGPCDTITGVGCPVEGMVGCECLTYAPDTSEYACYYIEFYFNDNVGNEVISTWKVCLDTDEVISFEVDDDPGDIIEADRTISPDSDGWYEIYGYCGDEV